MLDLLKARLIEAVLERHREYEFYLKRAHHDTYALVGEIKDCTQLCDLVQKQADVVALRVMMQLDILEAIQREPKI